MIVSDDGGNDNVDFDCEGGDEGGTKDSELSIVIYMIIVDYISRYTEQLLTDCQCNVCICQARSRKHKYLMLLIELGELEANEWIPRVGDLQLAIFPEQ